MFKQNTQWTPNMAHMPEKPVCPPETDQGHCSPEFSRFCRARLGTPNLVKLLIPEMVTGRAREEQEPLCQWERGHIPLSVCITGRACGHLRPSRWPLRGAYPIFGSAPHSMVQQRASSCVIEGPLAARLCLLTITA